MIIRGHSVSNETAEKIAEAIQTLNWKWGCGDVTEVTFLSTADNGMITGTATRQIRDGHKEERAFQVMDNTVFFLTHPQTL